MIAALSCRRMGFLSLLLCMAGLAGCGTQAITTAQYSYQKGMQLYGEQLYTEAAGAFRDAVRQDPRHHRAQFYLGVCYDEMSQHQQAFKQYHTVLNIMPSTMAGQADTEFKLIVQDTLASAIARYDINGVELAQAINETKTRPSADAWFLLAKIHRVRGDADSAIEAYRNACNWDSKSFAVRREFGLYLLDPLAQNTEAEFYLKQAYRLNPTDQAVLDGLQRLGVAVQPRQGGPAAGPQIAAPPAAPARTPSVVAPTPGGSAAVRPEY